MLLIAGIISAITFLPSSNLIFVVGFVLAERNLYLPSIGSSLLVAYCFIEKGHLKFLVYLIVIFYIRSVQRSFEWIDQPALFKSGLKVSFNSNDLFFFTNIIFVFFAFIFIKTIKYNIFAFPIII